MTDVALGFMAHIGWLNVAAVRVSGGDVKAVRTARLDTCPPGDTTAREPYHVAGGFDGLNRVAPPPEPASVVESGLRQQQKVTTTNLGILLNELRELQDWQATTSWAALFTGRGKQPDTLMRTLASHAHIHIAEGNAVRLAVRQACATHGIQVALYDKRDFSNTVSTTLGRSLDDVLDMIGEFRPQDGGRWRKDEKLCALAAWVALQAAS